MINETIAITSHDGLELSAGALIGARNVRKLGQPTGPHARTYGHGTTPGRVS
jgi:hypothetical protein